MNEISFVPDYGIRSFLEKAMAFLIVPIFVIGMWIYMVGNNYVDWRFDIRGMLPILLEAGVPILYGFFLCYQHPKEFVIGQSQVVIRKYIFPEQVYDFREYTKIDETEIRFRRKAVSLSGMKNVKELISIFQNLINEQKIQPGSMPEKLADKKSQREQVVGYAGAFTILFLIAWYGIWYLFINDMKYFVNPEILGVVVFVVAYFGISLFLKNKNN